MVNNRRSLLVSALALPFVFFLFLSPFVSATVSSQVTASQTKYQTQDSPYWAGFAVQSDNLSIVRATWFVPTISCTSRENSRVSFVSGIGNFNTANIRDSLGTTSACTNGDAVYWAWYSLANKVTNISQTLKAGDLVRSEVQVYLVANKPGLFHLILQDYTQGWRGKAHGDQNGSLVDAVFGVCCGATLSSFNQIDSGKHYTGIRQVSDIYTLQYNTSGGSQVIKLNMVNPNNGHVLAVPTYDRSFSNFYVTFDQSS